eukprot:jgi/Galph1/4670/GphlegSOOS_G3402.1
MEESNGKEEAESDDNRRENVIAVLSEFHAHQKESEASDMATLKDATTFLENRQPFVERNETSKELNIREQKNANSNHSLSFSIGSSQKGSGTRRKRNTYATEEERRIARILKNRRTAEESRLRRIQRIQELQDILLRSQERERKLNEEIMQLRQELASQVAEVNRLRAALLRRHKQQDKYT